jgi:hypothetical protein
MAEKQSGVNAYSSAKKKKLPSIKELIQQGKDHLGERKRKRKPVHYEFSNDPTTGRRNCKNTYTPRGPNSRSREIIAQSVGDTSAFYDPGESIDPFIEGKSFFNIIKSAIYLSQSENMETICISCV